MENYTALPSQFTIGDTLVADLAPGDYPPPDYTLLLVCVSATSKISVESTAADGYHRLTVDTSLFTAGDYNYQLTVIGDAYRQTISTGTMQALPSFADAACTAYDGRSHVKKTLDALEAAIEGRASSSQLKMEFDGQAIEYMDLEQQIRLRDQYRCKYQREQAAATGRSGWRTITPRFAA